LIILFPNTLRDALPLHALDAIEKSK